MKVRYAAGLKGKLITSCCFDANRKITFHSFLRNESVFIRAHENEPSV